MDVVRQVHEAVTAIGAGEDSLRQSVLVPRSAGEASAVFAAEIEWAAPRRILEIGTLHGASAAMWAMLAPDAEIVTVDIRGASEHATALWRALRVEARIRSVRSTSYHAPNGPFGIVFVDAVHTPRGVATDILAVRSRLAKPRASVVFDDLRHHQGGGAVIETLPTFRAAGRFGVARVEEPAVLAPDAVVASWPREWTP